MLNKFLPRTAFETYEDFAENFQKKSLIILTSFLMLWMSLPERNQIKQQ